MTGGIGKAVSRLDGPEKVTGRARYTGDMHLADMLQAVIVPATRPNAWITLDLADASASPGVVAIFTHRNMPKLASFEFVFECGTVLPLQDDRIMYEGQPAALVVADTLERATEAARRVKVSYRDEPFEAAFSKVWTARRRRSSSSASHPTRAQAMHWRPGPKLK